MIFAIRVGLQEYEEIDLPESQMGDFIDFILNGGYNPGDSPFLNNQAIVAILRSGQPLTADLYEDYKHQLIMQK